MLDKIISGGQSGVDRAALDTAIARHIEHGGYCPKGRGAEDGIISAKYSLIETALQNVEQRTKKNIEQSDATLVFVSKLPIEVKDGTLLTINHASFLSKPLFIIDLSDCKQANQNFYDWLKQNNISVLNVAGPRESSDAGMYNRVCKKFDEMLNFIFNMERAKN